MTRPSKPLSPVVRSRTPLRHRVHRVLGIATGLLLVYLIATGLPLQFTTSLNLASSHVTNALVLDWYGIPAPLGGYRSDAAVYMGKVLFWNGSHLTDAVGFQGAVQIGDLAAVAAGRKLLVFPAAEPEHLETVGLRDNIRQIGLTAGGIVLETDSGMLAMDSALLNPIAAPEVTRGAVAWSKITPLTGAELTTYQRHARSRVLSSERFLQDLHSGRAFGSAGEWLVNLAALAMVVLSFSGLMIWLRTR